MGAALSPEAVLCLGMKLPRRKSSFEAKLFSPLFAAVALHAVFVAPLETLDTPFHFCHVLQQTFEWRIPKLAMVLALVDGLLIVGGDSVQRQDGISKQAGSDHAAARHQDSPSLNLTEVEETEQLSRPCTVDELLPHQTKSSLAPEWSTEFVTDFPFNCTCPFYKARYYCPHVGSEGYPKWVSQSVANGVCDHVSYSELMEAPFPPLKVLFYGNSHMRQVLESIMCTFQQAVSQKRVTLEQDRKAIVPGLTQCRDCSSGSEAFHLDQLLLDHDCMSEANSCKCSDGRGQFFFPNEAVVHFFFAGGEKNKSFETALKEHEVVDLSFYDVVIANNGNYPQMENEYVIKSAEAMHDVGVQLIWLNSYQGSGNIANWNEDKKTRFAESGAKFLPVEYMVRGLERYRKGDVEPQVNPTDAHYCLPGPPTEIGLLLLQLLWATYGEHNS